MGLELLGGATVPAAAEEEHDGGSLVLFRVMAIGIINVEDELGVARFLVDQDLGALEWRRCLDHLGLHDAGKAGEQDDRQGLQGDSHSSGLFVGSSTLEGMPKRVNPRRRG